MSTYTLEKTIDLAIQAAVQKAKKEAILECRLVGSYFLTETEDDPNVLFGGRWQKLTGRYVLQCSDAYYKAGTTVEAGLPDLTGTLEPIATNRATDSFTKTGVFINTTHMDMSGGSGSATQRLTVRFKASSSNPIYGRSDTVQPPARIVNVWKGYHEKFKRIYGIAY